MNTGAVDIASISLEGSPDCISYVACQEVGATYPVGGVTKYGSWYGEMIDECGYRTAAWCAMFVSWCAYHACVPDTVIPMKSWCPDMADFFKERETYYHSASGGGDYMPQPGDVIFLGVNDNDTFDSPGHVGIVILVANGVVFFVDGNVTTHVNGVKMKTVSLSQKNLTATDILAYGDADYTNHSHTIEYWDYDDGLHCGYCTVCDGEVMEDHDLVPYDTGYICITCGYYSDV